MLSSIRARMLVAALLPVFLVVVALVIVFWLGRVNDMNESHAQRGKLLLQQTILASELGLFSGNFESLQSVVNGVHREAEVQQVTVFDASGVALAHSGESTRKTYQEVVSLALLNAPRIGGVDTFYGAIATRQIALDDLYSEPYTYVEVDKPLLGYAVVQLAREGLARRQREMFFLAVGVGLAGLILGGLLAARLGEGVVSPILRVSRMMERIGRGDFSSRIAEQPDDPMYELQTGLNRMAMRLEWGRDELEQRVREATTEISARKEEAEAATLAKSRFLAAASHDLRQPTHALGMFIARLGQLPLDEPTRKLVGNLEASAHAMQDLLDSLLDISRLDAGVVPVHPTQFAVQVLFDKLAPTLSSMAAAKGLRLRIRPTLLWASTDAALLQRMVMNLVQNAINYTAQGTVLVACRPTSQDTHVRIEVWDSGIGISAQDQLEIYKEFYQVGNRGRDRNQGLGLGLNIVERSAQLFGVEVGLQSEPGCGTRFTLRVPAVPAGAIDELAPEPTVASDLAGVCVLLIEDDASARTSVSELLESWGCRVAAAAHGAAAMEMVRLGIVPTVVVSDYRLGEGVNGLQAIALLRETLGENLPACLMSGDTDATLMHAAQSTGLTLLHKPVRPAKLRSLLRRLAAASNAPTVS